MAYFFLIISLVIIPLCLEFSFFPILPDAIMDFRYCKDFLAVLFILLICLNTLYTKGISRQKFIWPSILFFYLLIHRFLVSKLLFNNYSDQTIASLWQFEPLAQSLTYYLLFMCLQEIDFTESQKEIVLRVMMWVGFISAIYVVIQWFGLDIYQSLNFYQASHVTTQGTLTSFMTHPNYSSSFIALCLPAAVYFRNYFKALIMIIAVLLTKCWFSTIAMTGGLTFYGLMILTGKQRSCLIAALGFLFGLVIIYFAKKGHIPNNHGRFETWLYTIKDILQRPIFGYGLGSYRILFTSSHQSVFRQAHNELLQFIYETGIVGGMILTKNVWEVCKGAVRLCPQNEKMISLTSSLIVILLSSLGLFVFQIEPHRYFTVVIASILAI